MTGDPAASEERIERALRGLRDDDARLEEPPADLWSRIEAETAVDSDTIAEPERRGPVAAPTPLHRGAGRRPARRGQVLVAVAAAVLVVVGAVALVAGRDGGGAEVVAEATLSGDGLDAGADTAGSARLVRDGDEWRITVDAADLEPRGSDSYYEAWLLGPGVDRVQSLGALDGTGDFLVPGGLDIDDFPVVDVSIEPFDGDPTHSTQSVLRGVLERS